MLKLSVKITLVAGSGVLVMAGSSLALAAPALALSTMGSDSERTAAVQARLDETKLKVCTTHKKNIDGILGRVAERGSKHLTLVNNVASRTEAFYAKSGKTLDSYDSLVATVNSDKTAAEAAVAQVKTDSTSFTCDGADPVGTLRSFKADVHAQVTALQTYKASVKALVSGVKSVVETSTGGSNND